MFLIILGLICILVGAYMGIGLLALFGFIAALVGLFFAVDGPTRFR